MKINILYFEAVGGHENCPPLYEAVGGHPLLQAVWGHEFVIIYLKLSEVMKIVLLYFEAVGHHENCLLYL